MAQDEGKKEEEKFDFTSEGEAVNYISLDQARVLAIEHAQDNTATGALGAPTPPQTRRRLLRPLAAIPDAKKLVSVVTTA